MLMMILVSGKKKYQQNIPQKTILWVTSICDDVKTKEDEGLYTFDVSTGILFFYWATLILIETLTSCGFTLLNKFKYFI